MQVLFHSHDPNAKSRQYVDVFDGFVLVETTSIKDDIIEISLHKTDHLTRVFMNKLLHLTSSPESSNNNNTTRTPVNTNTKYFIKEKDNQCYWELVGFNSSTTTSKTKTISKSNLIDIESKRSSTLYLKSNEISSGNLKNNMFMNIINDITQGKCPNIYINFLVKESQRRMNLQVITLL